MPTSRLARPGPSRRDRYETVSDATCPLQTPLARAFVFVAGIFVAGTIGYRILEDASWWDSFSMTVITVTTVGYEEEVPLSRLGEIFTSVLLLTGLGVLLFSATEISRSVVEGESCVNSSAAYGDHA